MKKTKSMLILITLCLAFVIPSIFAITETNINIQSDEDINSQIIQVGKNVNTDIACIGEECTYNIYDGEVYLENKNPNTIVNNNNYYDKQIIKQKDFSFNDLINIMSKSYRNYMFGDYNERNQIYDFFKILDTIFVSHKENYQNINNIEYLSNEIDELKAKNKILEQHINREYNTEILECETLIMKAKRTGQKIKTDKFTVDLNLFGEKCVSFNNIN